MSHLHLGNLALSRALGDFEFKKNYSMSPERQVITADPDVTCHEITEDDEFLVLACDGPFGLIPLRSRSLNRSSLQVSGTASVHNKWSTSSDTKSPKAWS